MISRYRENERALAWTSPSPGFTLPRVPASARAIAHSYMNWPCILLMLAPGVLNCQDGSAAGEEREVAGVKVCWCPAGKFVMGSPRNEPERRPGEDQVEVTLTKGFWMAKFETTQGQWKRVSGSLPGPLTAELPEGDDFPVGNVNFAEAEAFCRKLTELGHGSGSLPKDWEFRLPTEAQWEYACRAGTTTATSFGDKLSSKQVNFGGKPYQGGEPGPSLKRAAKVGSYAANPWGLHDMHGNTFEWCRDWYHAKLPGGTDPDLARCADHGLVESDGRRITCAPWRMLGRRRLAVPLCLSVEVSNPNGATIISDFE
jgi:formylglycine-generating enzyme required for sulfatase activity